MTILSLFDGISCGRVALERVGIEVEKYYSSEIDKYAIQVADKNYPDNIKLGDITKWREWDINWSSIDLLLGGSPCQGFSRQGMGLNFKDLRSKLFFEYVDILNHIKTINPNIKFLLENVSMKKEWRNVISEKLGVGYVLINSCDFLPQNRPRLYWCNWDIKPWIKRSYKLKDLLDTNIDYKNLIDYRGLKIDLSFSQNSIKLVDNVCGQIRIAQTVKIGYAIACDGDGINISFPTSKSRRGRVLQQKSSCLDSSCNFGVLDDNVIRRFTINELEKLQGLPINYTDIIPKQQRVKAIGNGWTVDVITHILKSLFINKENYFDKRTTRFYCCKL